MCGRPGRSRRQGRGGGAADRRHDGGEGAGTSSGFAPTRPRTARTSWRHSKCSPSRSPKGSARCSWACAPATASRAILSTTPRVQLLAFAAHHEERDKAREERKRREAEAKLELEAARERAEKAEDEKQKAEGRVRELEAGTASGTEAAAVHEAQPVPDAVPKPLDLPAAWTLPVGELIKAGDVVARKAEAKWGVADSSPTAMPLDGIDGVPVLTFTPVRGLFRKQPASWRYEDAGRYAGEAAIEIEQPDITDRNLDWPDWRAAGEALSRALVTDALEDGAERRAGWKSSSRTSTRNTGRKSAPGNITGSTPGPTWARCPAASRTARGP